MDSGDDDSAHADLDVKSDADIAALPADGETAEWEEAMVADIVVARSDRVDLIKAIGRAYPSMNGSDDFHKGLNKLEWQLDGSDETRVHGVLKMDATAPASESGEWWCVGRRVVRRDGRSPVESRHAA